MTTPTVTVEIHIYADSLAELREQLQKALDDMGWAPQPTPMPENVNVYVELPADIPPVADIDTPMPAAEPEKPKRTRKAKEAPAPVVDPTPAPAVEESPAPAEAPAAATPAVAEMTHDEAKAVAEAWINKHPDGAVVAKKEVRGYLATFGVQRVAELPESQLADFVAMFDDGV
jgi:outer membrane biosynthesis protein TonB